MRVSRRVILGVLAGLMVGALGVGQLALDPDGFARKVPIPRMRACACQPEREVSFAREDGLRLAASLYGAASDEVLPAFLLLHGRRARGRAHPLYRILASQLAGRGYRVVAVDLAGFGESENPFQLGDPAAVTNVPDVQAALEFLRQRPDVDADRIHLIGHSMGAGLALQAGLTHPWVRGIVAISPTRRLDERLQDPGFRDHLWSAFRGIHRRIYDRDPPSWYSREHYVTEAQRRDLERYVGMLARSGHKPVLFVDGGREPAAERMLLLRHAERAAPPVDYVLLPNADHFANTASLGSRIQLFDGPVMGRLVTAIDDWAHRQDAREPEA